MSQKSKTESFGSDHPLEDIDGDLLNRGPFCKALADNLANRKGQDSLTVGITGNWGSGKSTIKNFVKDALNKKNPKPVVIEFNPWEWSGQGKLLEAFLWSLSEALSKSKISGKNAKLGKRLKQYSVMLQEGGAITSVWATRIPPVVISMLSVSVVAATEPLPDWVRIILCIVLFMFMFIVFSRVLNKLLSSITTSWIKASQKSMDKLRTDIQEDLKKIESPIIIFIDDIDRLFKEEIKLLFQLVRSNLNFKNLTFVLLFQRDIVASALDELKSGYGSDYIGKITQVELDVPKASAKNMKAFLREKIDLDIPEGEKQSPIDENRWRELFDEHLWHYFRNLRDIKRFSSSFHFYYQRHLNQGALEVDPVDLIAVEVLRVFDNEAYQKLARLYSTEESDYGSFKSEEQLREQFKEIAAHLDKESSQQEHLESLLQALFPPAVHFDVTEWHSSRRICHPKCFHRYFELFLDASEATRLDLDTILSNAHDRAKVVELLRAAIKKGTIHSLLTQIFYGREYIRLASMSAFITALFDVGDELPKKDQSQGHQLRHALQRDH